MVSLEKIEREIDELLTKDTTYAVCERLCWLYTVRNNLRGAYASEDEGKALTGQYSGSEFMSASSQVPIDDVLGVLDEHMAALKVVQPREYEAVMNRIASL